MKVKEYPAIGETVLEARLDNGLVIYLFPKTEFEKNFAFFAANYGGMDTRYQWKGVWQDTPLGVAHFLEHKMFDTKDGNALQMLSAGGASPNAFTGSAITGYYFEGTENFDQNLKTLLSFVSEAYFTEESVEKEQGIIGQEIQMIEDNPNWQVYMNLVQGLYDHHPLRNSVAGSKESIAEITADVLYRCHEAFYNPGNMVLCIAGNVDMQNVLRLAKAILPQTPGAPVPRDYGEAETITAGDTYRELSMEVSAPLFQLGFKFAPAGDGDDRLRQKIIGSLLCEVWMGASSPLYATLYKEGLINSAFYSGLEDYPGAAFMVFGGESQDPKAVQAAMLAEAKRLLREGIDQARFDRLKKAAYGANLRALNSFEYLCVEQARAHFARQDVWIFPDIYATIQKGTLENALREWISEEAMSLSVILPRGREE